eukprot:UN30534
MTQNQSVQDVIDENKTNICRLTLDHYWTTTNRNKDRAILTERIIEEFCVIKNIDQWFKFPCERSMWHLHRLLNLFIVILNCPQHDGLFNDDINFWTRFKVYLDYAVLSVENINNILLKKFVVILKKINKIIEHK